MGATHSVALNSERELLTAGIQWYQSWRQADAPSSTFKVRDVPIGSGLHLHTVQVSKIGSNKGAPAPPANNSDLPLVCMHGFATGLAMYYAALPVLAERWAGSVFAIDTLGCSLSSRPRWHLDHGIKCKVSDAEDFFVDGLERWRRAMKIERFVLMGHSLGGYLAVAYAEKHPERVERLILVSAVGTPEPPKALSEAQDTAPLPFKAVLGAWKAGWSPFTIAKLGLGRAMLGRYVQARFGDASWVKKPELENYLHGSWTGANNSAGGYAHSTLLLPGGLGELAYARSPTGPRRIPSLAVARVSAIYGDRDWMDWRHMAEARRACEAKRLGDGAAAQSVGPPEIEILHVADASHNVQVDNPLGFVDAVMATCKGGAAADGKIFGGRYYSEDHARS